jgi:hypothetical protein
VILGGSRRLWLGKVSARKKASDRYRYYALTMR